MGQNLFGIAKRSADRLTMCMLQVCGPLVDPEAVRAAQLGFVVSRMTTAALVAYGHTNLMVLGKIGDPRWAGHLAFWESRNYKYARSDLFHVHEMVNKGHRLPRNCFLPHGAVRGAAFAVAQFYDPACRQRWGNKERAGDGAG